ncbi:ABC transporter permease [Pseudomonas aeruginosa]|uniref:ABC transporter permease n=1 Tax=Pseudomonas aeruginosa TaxID=287 RepID=UPI00287F6663|nr:ABC transporter permease [Pseudomonas aeruginosa]
MRSLANIFNLGIKEFRSLGRDYAMLALIVWAFTLGVYSSATGIPETLHHAPIAVVDEDRSQLSSRIVNAFQPPYFRPPEMIGHAEMDRGMDVGLYTFTLDIPPDFQRDVLAGRKPSIQVNVDATQTGQAFSGAGYIQNIVATEVREFVSRYRAEPSMPAQIEVRMEFNPNLTQAWFGGVMEVINQITMLSIILTGAALIREREHGTVEHLLVMPLSAFEIMMAKVWSMGLFLLGAGLHLFATTSMGIFLGTVARSMPQLGLLTILVLLPLNILSGGTTPRESMPELVQNIMLAAPTTHFVSLAQAILFRGAGFDIVWPQFAGIVVIGSAFFFGALWRFRRTISQMA